MELIKLDDLKTWRAKRIQQGDCNFDDMVALAAFISRVDRIEVNDECLERNAVSAADRYKR